MREQHCTFHRCDLFSLKLSLTSDRFKHEQLLIAFQKLRQKQNWHQEMMMHGEHTAWKQNTMIHIDKKKHGTNEMERTANHATLHNGIYH